ncbi:MULTISPECIES: SRPBCC family protein [unclassified Mucilaginibacter]|uniref:SRPBCC family protein n=1 Tax=unclassified Mucilaginibacter TaxID=2617802 RepID=UPI00095C8B72|nr:MULTISPECIES: SRPBCC family protein [unclassified Mucilaginibacter]OJW17535.1 MAG: polyketide cyclase [Mucilaginibacter sp. 44-25]PLW89799.1 MAG: polyketide cyclase [Mucilaginibacter sp.]HEK18914.1 polyketide cyclase [Bacteroidota bacterium]
MDTLLTIIGIIAGIVLAVLALSLIAAKSYTIQRKIVINRPVMQVFNYIKYLRNQDNYSKWVMLDPNKRITDIGADGTVGFNSAWDSDVKQVGKGNHTITNIIEGKRLDTRVVFIKPFAGVADVYMATQAISNDVTEVTWSFSSKMPMPMNIMLLFINMEKMLGRDIEESLNNLKTVLEKQA